MAEASLIQNIRTDLHAAMKAGNRHKADTLRMIISDAQKEEIERQRNLTSEEAVALVKRAIKTRMESITQFEKGERLDLADKEKEEIRILTNYLPSQLTGEALKTIVQEVITTLKATSRKDMGLVMKTIMAKYGSQVNGKEVQALVSELLK